MEPTAAHVAYAHVDKDGHCHKIDKASVLILIPKLERNENVSKNLYCSHSCCSLYSCARATPTQAVTICRTKRVNSATGCNPHGANGSGNGRLVGSHLLDYQ